MDQWLVPKFINWSSGIEYCTILLLALSLAPVPAYSQKPSGAPERKPVETSVCKIFENPSLYNNRLVKVRGYVDGNFEYSLLLDERCPDASIWFAFADGSGTPQLEVTVSGKGTPGGSDSKGRRTRPLPVHLIRDPSFETLMHYLELSAKGRACADGPSPEFPPDCNTYRVAATFTGRVEGVSKQIHEKHLKRSDHDPVDGLGFGHMGMFDAQIVVQSVENVGAVFQTTP